MNKLKLLLFAALLVVGFGKFVQAGLNDPDQYVYVSQIVHSTGTLLAGTTGTTANPTPLLYEFIGVEVGTMPLANSGTNYIVLVATSGLIGSSQTFTSQRLDVYPTALWLGVYHYPTTDEVFKGTTTVSATVTSPKRYAAVPNCDNCKIQVTATDGRNTGIVLLGTHFGAGPTTVWYRYRRY